MYIFTTRYCVSKKKTGWESDSAFAKIETLLSGDNGDSTAKVICSGDLVGLYGV